MCVCVCVEKFPEAFLPRCDKAVDAINEKYTYISGTAVVIVTHAAGCIGLAASAAGVHIDEINAAAPCSIYKLTRSSDNGKWQICDINHGYKKHITKTGNTTWPWHFSGFIKDADE